MPLERIDKLISLGLGVSRKDAQKLISSGAVLLDERKAASGKIKADPAHSVIKVNGQELNPKEYVYLIMNKPAGYICSTSDPQKTVMSLIPKELFRRGLFPAGRLDKYSEGMLIITDDGDFAHRILSPKHHLPKTYEVSVDRPVINGELIETFAGGVDIGKGQRSSPAVLKPLSETSVFRDDIRGDVSSGQADV